MKEIKTDKGFFVIEMSPAEAKSIGFGIPNEGCVCMCCNRIIDETIYYVTALNDCMCRECYEAWYQRATYYKEDSDTEERNFEYVEYLLKQAEAGNTIEPTGLQIYPLEDIDYLK